MICLPTLENSKKAGSREGFLRKNQCTVEFVTAKLTQISNTKLKMSGVSYPHKKQTQSHFICPRYKHED